MAYVQSFEHDVFVSYASVDDEPIFMVKGNDAGGWVSALERNLTVFTRMKLRGRGRELAFWRDEAKLEPGQLDDQLFAAVEASAVLLVVLSRQYLASSWCANERHRFQELIDARDRGGRHVVVVECDQFEDELPVEFRSQKRVKLWRDVSGRPQRLGIPVPMPGEDEYFTIVQNLAHDLAAILDRLREDVASRRGGPAPERWEPEVSGNSSPQHVYVAEVTDDVEFQRQELVHHLDSARVPVLPQSVYPRSPEEFARRLDADLGRCSMMVQLLGRFPGKSAEGLADGYRGLQFQHARARGIPVLQWIAEEDYQFVFGNGSETLASYGRFLKGLEQLHSNDFGTFKHDVLTEVGRLAGGARKQAEDGAHVLIAADESDPGDRGFADVLAQTIDTLGYTSARFQGSTAEARDEGQDRLSRCPRVLYVYGSCPASFVQNLMVLGVKARRRSEVPQRSALCLAPPPSERQELAVRVRDLVTLDFRKGIEPDELSAFLEDPDAAGAPA